MAKTPNAVILSQESFYRLEICCIFCSHLCIRFKTGRFISSGAVVDTMILAVTATQMERDALNNELGEALESTLGLVAGVGPVETALQLTRYLCEKNVPVQAVLNYGVAGAYLQPAERRQAGLLDLCLAITEIAGDFGICCGDDMEHLPARLAGPVSYAADQMLTGQCQDILHSANEVVHLGSFITVNGASGTQRRGESLRAKWNGLCENMEGAAVARVCEAFGLPFIELRCVSNFVEDRNLALWRLEEACLKAGRFAALLLRELRI